MRVCRGYARLCAVYARFLRGCAAAASAPSTPQDRPKSAPRLPQDLGTPQIILNDPFFKLFKIFFSTKTLGADDAVTGKSRIFSTKTLGAGARGVDAPRIGKG